MWSFIKRIQENILSGPKAHSKSQLKHALFSSLVENSGPSFIFGASTAFLREIAFKEDLSSKNPLLVERTVQVLRKGVSQAEQSILYNAVFFVCRYLRLQRRISQIVGILASTFLLSKRNGIIYGMRSALANFIFLQIV